MAKIAIDQIEVIEANRVRVKVDLKRVDEYAEDIKAGAKIPAILCFSPKNSQRIILSDGEHRLLAATKAGRKVIGVEIKEGGVQEALHYALSANGEHGLRRSSADKSHAVQMALKAPEYDQWSLREVGDLCRVSHELVRRIKESHNEDKKKVTPRPRKPAPTQDQMDKKELLGALATITCFPYDGRAGYAKLELVSEIDTLELVRDWCDEAIAAHNLASS